MTPAWKSPLACALLMALAATTQAQIAKGFHVDLEFADRTGLVGKKLNVVTRFWCGSPELNVMEITGGSSLVSFARNHDLRDIKDISFNVNTTDPVPLTSVRSVALAPAASLPRPGELILLEKGSRVPAMGRPGTAFGPIVLTTPMQIGPSRPLVLKWTRGGAPSNLQFATRLEIAIDPTDDMRSDSNCEMLIETVDGQLIDVPLGSVRGSERRTVTKSLSLPVPEHGIKRVHFWFNNARFADNRPFRNDDPFASPDDTRFTYWINGVGGGSRLNFVQSEVARIEDWTNGVSREFTSASVRRPDAIIDGLSFFVQTGASPFTWNDPQGRNALMRVVARTRTNEDVTLLDQRTNPLAGTAASALFAGGFGPKQNAFSRPGTPVNLYVSLIASLRFELVPPPRTTARYSMTWDVKSLAVMAHDRLAGPQNVLDQICLFATLGLNRSATLNMNQSGPGTSSLAVTFPEFQHLSYQLYHSP